MTTTTRLAMRLVTALDQLGVVVKGCEGRPHVLYCEHVATGARWTMDTHVPKHVLPDVAVDGMIRQLRYQYAKHTSIPTPAEAAL